MTEMARSVQPTDRSDCPSAIVQVRGADFFRRAATSNAPRCVKFKPSSTMYSVAVITSLSNVPPRIPLSFNPTSSSGIWAALNKKSAMMNIPYGSKIVPFTRHHDPTAQMSVAVTRTLVG